MKTFIDNKNRTWTVAVNVATVKQLRDTLNINLMEAITGDLIEKLKSDPVFLVDVLFVICKKQAEELKISDVDFGEAMAGDAISNATNAFLEDVIDFFPSLKRGPLRRAFQKCSEAEEMAIREAAKHVDGIDVKKIVGEKLKSITGFSGSSEGSSESIRDDSPSAN